MPDERYFEPAVETMPRSEIEARQEARILELVPYVYERSGLIHQAWKAAGVHPRDIRSLDDFRERAPFMSKDAIRQYRDSMGDPYGGMLCVDPSQLTSVFSSSGTTGDATFFLEQWDAWAPIATSQARCMWEIGVRPGDYAFCTGATYRGPWYQQYQMCGAIPMHVATMGAGEEDWLVLFDVIDRYRPVHMHLLGPNLITLDHLSQKYDLKEIFSSFKGVGYGGEPLGARMRQRLSEWGLEVFVLTSAGDLGTSQECPEHNGMHLWEDIGFFEHLVPGTNERVPDGEVGELVSTALDNPAQPLMRYRTEDLVRFTTETCACGRTHARQWPMGRKSDEVVVEGLSILPIDIWSIVETIPETQDAVFQLIRPQRNMERLRIRVGYNAAVTRSAGDLGERVRDAVERAVGVEPELELVDQDELLTLARAHKLPRIAKA